MRRGPAFALVALMLAVCAPASASAAVAPRVIVAAEAFWAPYNGGVAPCGDALLLVGYVGDAAGGSAYAWADRGAGCVVHYDVAVFAQIAERNQCALIAHEIGHAFFGLAHSDDPANIMSAGYPGMGLYPPECAPLGARRRHRHPRWVLPMTSSTRPIASRTIPSRL